MPVKSWFRTLFLILPDQEERQAFRETLTRQNVARVRPVAILSLLVEIVLFIRTLILVAIHGETVRAYAYMALYLIMSILMCFALVLVRLYRNDIESGVKWAGIIAPVGTGVALLWGATATLVDLSGTSAQGSTMIAMQYLMMVLFLMPPGVALGLIAGVEALFVGCVLFLLPNPSDYTGVLLNTAINAALAWVVSRCMYASSLTQFRSTRTVHEKNAQLSKLNQVLAELSVTDPLTMLMNRRHFDETAQKEWRRACREGHRLTIAIADVDDFKPYNDLYGHQAGDECLYNVASAMQAELRRATDTLARFGGEEFIILLRSDSDLKDEVTLRRVKDAVEALKIKHEGSRASDNVTISIGSCTLTPSGDHSVEEMVARADRALYRAKAMGRNALVCDVEP